MTTSDWSEYVSADLISLLARLSRVAQEIAAKHTDLANLQVDERREKARAWQDDEVAGLSSTSARDRWAQIQSLSFTTEIIETEAAITVLKLEYDLILTIISARFANAKHIDDLNDAAARARRSQA